MSKKTTSIMAVIVLLLMILAGTFAWTQYNQHKTNEANGPGLRYDVSLIEDFAEIKDWKASESYKKVIKVKNSGLTDGSYGDVYIRLQLKEYMEMYPIRYTYTDERLMIGKDGKFITYATEALARAAYSDRDPLERKGIEDTSPQWYIPTKAGDDNGQYGKFLILSATSGDATPIVENTKRATDTESHDLATNGECAYPEHVWGKDSHEDCERGFHEYIKWFLGEDVISLEEWGTDYDSLPVEAWIYDTRSTNTEGWVYWGVALKPQKTTSNLLETVQLIRQPDDNFYYALHVDMEAVSLDEFTRTDDPKWTDAPTEIRTALTTPIIADVNMVVPDSFVAPIRGESISLSSMVSVMSFNGASETLNWTIEEDTVISGFSTFTVGKTSTDGGSTITQEGVLTIGRGETFAALKVTVASSVNPDKKASITIPVSGPMVTGVTVPTVAGAVTAGTTYTMGAATVKVTGDLSKEVVWSVSGNTSKDTTIGDDRVLRVALNETAESITVTATSTYDTTKFCPVTVKIASVTGVTVTTGDVTVYKGYTRTFASSVAGINSPAQDVTWSVEDAGSTDTKFNGATLKVGSDESKATFKVKATSTVNPGKSGTVTVTVAEVEGTTAQVINIKVTDATVAAGDYTILEAPTVTVVNGAAQTVTWKLEGKTSTATQFDSATRRLDVGIDEEAATFQLIATSTVNTTVSGTATITVRRVTGVTVSTGDVSVIKGYTTTFAASVAGVNSPAQTVTWSVEGAGSTNTYFSGAILKVAADETVETLTVRATSTVDTNPSKSGTATVTVTELGSEPVVTDIKLTDATLNTGGTSTRTAIVLVENGAVQTVTWALEGNTSTSTTINATTGALKVGMDEKAETFKVIATSTYDTTKSGTGIITVRRATSVTVTPDDVTVYKGYTKTFAVSVAGINSPGQGVTWSVVDAGSTATKFSSATLTVGSDETKSTFTIRATSTVTTTVLGEATVRVAELEEETSAVTNIAVVGATVNTGKTATIAVPTVTTVNGATSDVTWSVSGNTSTSTNINSATRLLTVGMDEKASTFQVIATSVDDPTVSGSATITVARATSVMLTPVSVVVAKGDTQGFSVSVAGVNYSATDNGAVTWSIISDTPKSTKTIISSYGGLTVGSDETNTELTIRAVSTVTTTVIGEAKVTVSTAEISTWEGSTADITGKAADVGKKFTADGYTWRILAVDGSGNMLVTPTVQLTTSITTNALYPDALAANTTKFNPATTDGNAYIKEDGTKSTLAEVMSTFYTKGIPTLKSSVQPVDIKTEESKDWSTTAIRDSGLSVVDESKEPMVFALSTSEMNKYFANNADRIATLNGGNSHYWLRSPFTSATSAGIIPCDTGVVHNISVTYANGVRPALWLHRVRP